MLSAPRPLIAAEHEAALTLWQKVFNDSAGYFERYYSGADPYFQTGDTLGVWDGGALVSAVHLCRRPVTWEGGSLLCGGIANVATLPDHRRKGLSRQLLALAITKMGDEGFHFSLLGTGTPGHYSALGWEHTRRPQAMLTAAPDQPPSGITWEKAGATASFAEAYSRSPRPLQFLRPAPYFEDWVGWGWRGQDAEIGTTAAGDYLLLNPAAADQPLPLLEWRATDQVAELSLLRAAAATAQERGHPSLWLDAFPQHIGLDELRSLGEVTCHTEGGGMVRNVTLPPDDYARVVNAYQSGPAVWWLGDGF